MRVLTLKNDWQAAVRNDLVDHAYLYINDPNNAMMLHYKRTWHISFNIYEENEWGLFQKPFFF